MSGHELILVIDDDLSSPRTLELLRSAGYRALAAAAVDEGLALATVHQPALILINLMASGVNGFELCKRLGRDVLLKHIPVMVMTPDEDDLRLQEVMGCIDDFVPAPATPGHLHRRIALALRRVQSMGGANPLTRLPGNAQIQEQIIERISGREPFALLYIDLDNFKAFNDHYGFLRGDEAIKLLARCTREAVVNHSATDGFVGHIGGDDLAAVVPAEVAEEVAHQIVNAWDNLSPNLYEPEDASRGYIEVGDRRGYVQRYPLASVSIGVTSNANRPLLSHWHASELAAEMKAVAKSRSGSTVAIDRRQDADLEAPRVTQSV
ncbi:MAG: diguanylate cyclase [Actinomycetota bacterium]